MSPHRNDRRLPPPAFPPGARKHVHRNSTSGHAGEGSYDGRGPFISPDEPMPDRRDSLERAFVAPDEEGVASGLGEPSTLDPGSLRTRMDPHVTEVLEALAKLTEAVRRKGEAGLRSSPGMSRFEATLRSYCVGYLAGRKAEGEVTER